MKTCPLCKSSDIIFKNYFENFKNKILKAIIYKLYFVKIIEFFFKKLFLKLAAGEDFFLFKKILICKNCEFGSVSPLIAEVTLNDYYSNNYWLDNRNIGKEDLKQNDKEIKNYLSKVNYLKKYVDFEEKTFAEFGCGRGILANEILKDKGVKFYNAIEISEISIIKELSVNYLFKNLKSIDFIKDNTIDIFIMIQSIEHLSDINIFFQSLKKKIKKSSLILIETPNYNKQYYKYKAGWTPHTLFFNEKSIKYLAKKFEFEIVDFQIFECPWSDLNCGVKKEENEEGHNLRILLRN